MKEMPLIKTVYVFRIIRIKYYRKKKRGKRGRKQEKEEGGKAIQFWRLYSLLCYSLVC